MKIVRNTSAYCTRDVRRVICAVHRHMAKLEGKPAPNWKRLRIAIAGRTEGSHVSGRAYLGGNGYEWDVFLTVPNPRTVQGLDGRSRTGGHIAEQRFARLVYHELMHTYGYRHNQYSDLPQSEADELFPDNAKLKLKKPKPERKRDIVQERYQRMLTRRKKWQSKRKRAENALSKLDREIRQYENRHGDRLQA